MGDTQRMDKMKKTILILLLLVIQSCGKSKSDSAPLVSSQGACASMAGEWRDQNANGALTIQGNCTAYEDRCLSDSTITLASDYSTSKQFRLLVTSSNGADNCLGPFNYTCVVTQQTSLTLKASCENGAVLLDYQRP